jgi:hypothetical protein
MIIDRSVEFSRKKEGTVQECGAAPAGDQTAAEAAMFRKFRSGKSIFGSRNVGYRLHNVETEVLYFAKNK